MNLTDPRLNPHLEAALQRIRTAAEQSAERGAEGMGMAALSAGQLKRRDALLSAQFLFRKQQAQFGQRFYQSLRDLMAGEQQSKAAAAPTKTKDWTELSLMDDDQVDAMVAADRIGLAIGHQSEWELREVQAYLPELSQSGERNPLRPELIAQALLDAIHAITDDEQTRQILVDELTRALSQELKSCYADIAELFRSRGLKPQDLRVRAAESPGHSVHGAHTQAGGLSSQHSVAGQDGFSRGGSLSTGGGLHGGASGHGIAGMPSSGGFPPAPRHTQGGMGSVDAQMMELLRRLAHMPAAAAGAGPADTGFGAEIGSFGQGWDDGGASTAWANQGASFLPPNLIHQHRDALRQAATGQLDHMVIDVVGSLFDQILSDPKVPPQMARLLARLQLPVLRAALGDRSFFSTRRHPVRRFVNRIASLACAFEDFSEDPGREFLGQVRELVQEVALGDFDRMDTYESKLDALEVFIAEQTAKGLQAQGNAAAVVERKEIDLRLQQRYTQQLQASLAAVPMPDFLRNFLAQVWSQAIVLASRESTGGGQRETRLRQSARDLVISVQPKGGTAQRQAFLSQLPGLMRTLNEGLDLIRWPEDARKTFFGELLPAHADSLKGQGLSPLDYNLLAKQLDTVFGCAPPSEQDLPAGGSVSVPAELDMGERLSPEEAKRLGLMDESRVDWNGQVDIDLGAEAPLQAADVSIEGLPAAEAPEPSEGELLIEHLQLGFAYQMNTGDAWRKVRLAHISAGRSFFIFTQGSKHQETVTMTARMLRKMCESGRLKAFENAYLLERATARARKQLAELGKGLESQH
ncbi:DUF1631 family protein [Roseateles sp.]|jgi:hypothetical protein|uniref:DUF1631 family protein n=1 Tax=Roseateles sp. TaxID=1971397 RepID=UPI0037C525F4